MKKLRLNCSRCASFRTFSKRRSDPPTVVRCNKCGKKHGNDSTYMVDPDRTFDRDEAGKLVDPPY